MARTPSSSTRLWHTLTACAWSFTTLTNSLYLGVSIKHLCFSGSASGAWATNTTLNAILVTPVFRAGPLAHSRGHVDGRPGLDKHSVTLLPRNWQGIPFMLVDQGFRRDHLNRSRFTERPDAQDSLGLQQDTRLIRCIERALERGHSQVHFEPSHFFGASSFCGKCPPNGKLQRQRRGGVGWTDDTRYCPCVSIRLCSQSTTCLNEARNSWRSNASAILIEGHFEKSGGIWAKGEIAVILL